MSLTVVTTPFDSIDQKDILLNFEQAGRILSVGSSWNVLRLGMRFAFTDAGANLGTGVELSFGVLASPSADMANGPMTGSTSHFLGLKWTTSWTRGTSPAVNYAATLNTSKRVGSTNTDSSLGATYASGAPSTIKPAVVLQITKGSPYSLLVIRTVNTSSMVAGTVSFATLTSAMNAVDMTAALAAINAEVGGSNYLGTGGNVTVNEGADGALNAACVTWNSSIADAYISEFLFRVVS